MKQIILIRHGTTEWNLTGRLNSYTDFPLNSKGRNEVRKLGKYIFQEFPDAHIWCSDLERAKETADAISFYLNRNYDILPSLREINFGMFEGKNPNNFDSEQDKLLYKVWQNNGFVDEAETLSDAARRVKQVHKTLLENDDSATHILISHGAFIRVLICTIALNVSPSYYRNFVVDNSSVSILNISDNMIRIFQLNNNSFL